MITISLTWHFLVVCVWQIFIIARLIYIYTHDSLNGMFGGLHSCFGTIFYAIISIAMWLIYGGIVWW